MKIEDSNWLTKWENELPSPEELTPISQTLITTELAEAFNLNSGTGGKPPAAGSGGDSGSSAATGGEEPARTLKRPRLVWTPQLHKRFVDAVAHLGIKNAVPKTIMQLMSVDGLTRENVASHLQKYRLYLKRMQGQNGNSGGGGGAGGGGIVDTASERLFASGPVPGQFLSAVRGNEHFVPPYVGNVGVLQHQHQQMAVMGGQFQRPIGHFGMQNGQFEHSFMASRPGQHVNRMGQSQGMMSYVEDLDGNGNAGRKVLTLFPTGENN